MKTIKILSHDSQTILPAIKSLKTTNLRALLLNFLLMLVVLSLRATYH